MERLRDGNAASALTLKNEAVKNPMSKGEAEQVVSAMTGPIVAETNEGNEDYPR